MVKDKYKKDNFVKLVKNSKTYIDIIRKLNLTESAGNYKTVKKYIKKYDIDISHFNPYHKNKSISNDKKPLNEILTKNSNYKSDKLKKRLLNKNLLEEKCDLCEQGTEWNGKKLVLQLDHIDGDSRNNELKNLRILCPNCHSQTNTFSGKSIHKNGKNVECDNLNCNNKIYKSKSQIKENNFCCPECFQEYQKGKPKYSQRKVKRPSKKKLKKDINELGYLGTGRKYGVSDNAIRKWEKFYKGMQLNG